MSKSTRFVGMDVHAETIAVAVAEGRHQARSLGTIANRPEAIRRLLGKLGDPVKCLLRGWADRVRAVLGAHTARRSLRRHRAEPGADQSG
jgi:hypothetical protein